MKKLNRKSATTPPPLPPFLKRPTPAPYFHSLFLIFQIPPPCKGGNWNLFPPPFKKRGGVQTMYICIAWGLTKFPQQKALRIMNSAPFNAHTIPLFKYCNILKFADTINVKSCVFLNNCFYKDSFSIFNEKFQIIFNYTFIYYYIS